jgi:hypothetical protein
MKSRRIRKVHGGVPSCFFPRKINARRALFSVARATEMQKNNDHRRGMSANCVEAIGEITAPKPGLPWSKRRVLHGVGWVSPYRAWINPILEDEFLVKPATYPLTCASFAGKQIRGIESVIREAEQRKKSWKIEGTNIPVKISPTRLRGMRCTPRGKVSRVR